MEILALPEPGEQFGPYLVLSVLGVGGMGCVYRAAASDQEIALKVVKPDLARDDIFRRRFQLESSIAERVMHPHILTILDRGEYAGLLFLSQPLLSGGSLQDRIARGPLDLKAAIRMCVSIGGALDALHAAGLIHRDLKPANILFDEDETPYLSDFGLARDTAGDILERPGQAIGSLDYMAPEQIRADEATHAIDVYHFGCMMWECIAGLPPFADRQGMRVLWAHLQDQAGDPCAHRHDVPPQLGPAILRALEKKPEDRPPTCGDYAQALLAASRVAL